MEQFGNFDLLPQVLDMLPVGIWLMDAEGTIVYGNPAARRIWGCAHDVGPQQFGEYKGWWHDSGEPIAAGEWAAARAILKGETSLDEEIEIECFDGTRKIILNSAMPIRDSAGAIMGGIAVNVDITARIAAEERLKSLVEHDSLTGVYSRRKFYELLGQEIQRVSRYGNTFSAIMFDLDHFKQINDTLGHHAGDEVLVALSQRVQASIRAIDSLCRLGGEEFVLLLPETGLREASALAEKLRQGIAAEPCGPALRLTCSFGVAQYTREEAADAFLQRLDHAMYRAKERGRDNVVIDLVE